MYAFEMLRLVQNMHVCIGPLGADQRLSVELLRRNLNENSDVPALYELYECFYLNFLLFFTTFTTHLFIYFVLLILIKFFKNFDQTKQTEYELNNEQTIMMKLISTDVLIEIDTTRRYNDIFYNEIKTYEIFLILIKFYFSDKNLIKILFLATPEMNNNKKELEITKKSKITTTRQRKKLETDKSKEIDIEDDLKKSKPSEPTTTNNKNEDNINNDMTRMSNERLESDRNVLDMTIAEILLQHITRKNTTNNATNVAEGDDKLRLKTPLILIPKKKLNDLNVNDIISDPKDNSMEYSIRDKIRNKRLLNDETLTEIWNSDNFHFKITKFKLLKLDKIPAMDIKNIKNLLKQKLDINAREIGGFFFLKESAFWLIFMRNETIIEKKILECNKFSTFTIEELVELKEQILKMKNSENFNIESMKQFNKPCAIALDICVKSLENSKYEDLKKIIEIDYGEIDTEAGRGPTRSKDL